MIQQLIVEFLGTLFLMYAVLATGNWAAIGAALGIAVLLGGKISGGAFNPAVAVGMYAAGKLNKNELVPYMIVEIMGALAAYYLYQNYINKSNGKKGN